MTKDERFNGSSFENGDILIKGTGVYHLTGGSENNPDLFWLFDTNHTSMASLEDLETLNKRGYKRTGIKCPPNTKPSVYFDDVYKLVKGIKDD